jgi:outer membrane protein assembly factor BamB
MTKAIRTSASRARMRRCGTPFAIVVPLAAALLLGGCETLRSWMPTIPAPSWSLPSWLGGTAKKIGPLPDAKQTASPQLAWQASIGKAAPGFAPTVVGDAVYAAAQDGTVVRIDAATGRTIWRIAAGKKLSAGAGADASLVAVGTDKGDVLAFDASGKPAWQARVSSEVVSPPRVADGFVVVASGDGRLYGLTVADGKTKWVYQRTNPPLTVRNYAGATTSRGGLFIGVAGGKLLAFDLPTGSVAWEANVATPKGATELERIADITSLPIIEEREACAVAFQGRVACFDLARGNLTWSRDVSSLEGMAVDNRYLYVTDDKGAIHALDKSTGASAWKQDKLASRKPGGPQMFGEFVGVVDVEGYLHLLDRNDGSLVGRAATDGTPATSQPVRAGANAVWLSSGGTLYAFTAR